MSLQRGINLRALAEKMGQCSGAEVRGICTEAGSYLAFEGKISSGDEGNLTGMYALRERRQHVTQEDFEFAVAKVGVNSIGLLECADCVDGQVLKKNQEGNTSVNKLFS
jgi:26S proteasome regulatory subunit T6